MIKIQAIAVKEGTMKDREGKEIPLNKVSFATPEGDVGGLYTQLAVKAGQQCNLGIAVKDGRLSLKIVSLA